MAPPPPPSTPTLQAQAFRRAASELGMASAARLFVHETAEAEGRDGVARLRDALGRSWPVLDAVCAAWLADGPGPVPDAGPLATVLDGAQRVVLVGHEADWVDALRGWLAPGVRLGLLQLGDPITHWPRLLANHGGRIEGLSLETFQAWAGPRSVLMTFLYGESPGQVFVQPAWLRVAGPDVRLQFRSLVGWRILQAPLEVYPRWLVAADAATLTDLR